MDWHLQRVEWNQMNQCSREACRGPLRREGDTGVWVYVSESHEVNLKYCPDCASLLNRHQPGNPVKFIED